MSLIHDTSTAIQALRRLDALGLAALISDTSGTVQLLNNAASALFREEPSHLEGQQLKDMPAFAPLAEMLAAKIPVISPRLVLLYEQLYCLVRMQQVGRVGYVFTFEDITTFKQREQEHNTAIDNVAHDLKAPISAIRGFADLVNNGGELNALQHKYLDRIYHSLNNMQALVDDLLDIAWMDSDQSLKLQRVHLGNLMQRALETLRNHAEKRNTQISTHIPDDLPNLFGDARRLERAFTNLVNNAIKYTPIGGQVTISLSADGEYQVVEVADTGIGIPEDYLPHIFKRFYRVPRQDEALAKIDGTGLGLAIVKSVIDLHQGNITVYSKVSEGSVFTVRLPQQPDTNSDPDTEPSHDSSTSL